MILSSHSNRQSFSQSNCTFYRLITLLIFLTFIQLSVGEMRRFLSFFSKRSLPVADDFNGIDILEVPELSFHRDLFTQGSKPRSQIDCTSLDNECDEGVPELIRCKNNDYRNSKKLTGELSWTCKPDKMINYYYIEQGSERVTCEELYKTSDKRYVVAGSCWLTILIRKDTTYRNLLFLIASLLVLGLVIGLVFYLRKKRRSAYTSI